MSTAAQPLALPQYAVAKLERFERQIVRCVRLLGDGDVWRRASGHTNSAANLVLHLTGNVRQWIIGGVGRQAISRDRSAEFAARGGVSGDEMLAALREVMERANAIIAELSPDDLREPREIQGYTVTVETAVVHVLEHFSGHTGQIVHMTKALRDVDLSLYDASGHQDDRLTP